MKTIDKQHFPQGENIEKTLIVLERIFKEYSHPSFGSMSKRDVDIMLFKALQDLEIIDAKPSIYDVIRLLNVTRSKARNLIYESSLQRQDEQNLEQELKDLIIKPIFLKEGDKVCIEVDNPLLIDYIRQRLKGLKHITDSSFNNELVKMTPEAFSALYTALLPEGSIDAINRKFVALGVQDEKGPLGVVKKVVAIITRAALGRSGEMLAEATINAIGSWLHGNFDNIPNEVDGLPGTIYENLLEA